MKVSLGWLWWVVGVSCGITAPARGYDGLQAYALVVGSNQGGAGQTPLTYAERDAERMADLLTELGRIPREHVDLLKHPRPAQLEQALSDLRSKLSAQAQRGGRSRLIFYYSGHARADALSLGEQELPISTLRAALADMPSTLTVVVLDACQSGAISGVKGASPAADFSASSVAQLRSEGIAIMASSTGAELSQESYALGSGYFTHHLLVALRGAGDTDRSGDVSLDEAYRYAYTHTLSDTARTRVGSQHATLETNLTGHGDVALTYTKDADAKLVFPEAVGGRILVQQSDAGAVMAELIKAAGAPIVLAVPRGGYDVLIRGEDPQRAKQCAVVLGPRALHTLNAERCQDITLDVAAEKHALSHERWFAELGFGIGQIRDDAYVQTLEDFRFRRDEPFNPQAMMTAAVGLGVHRHLSISARYETLDRRLFARDLGASAESFRWASHALSLGPRVRFPMWGERVAVFGEAGIGLGVARTHLERDGETYGEPFFGLAVRGAGGLTFGLSEHVGIQLSAGYTRAAVVRNDLGQRHEDGGFSASLGARLRSLKGWW